MPPNEATLLAAWLRVAGSRSTVVVAARPLAGFRELVRSLDALPAGPLAAILWAHEEPAPLAALRARLAPGGVLGVLAEPPRSALSRVLPWRAAKLAAAPRCTELLLAGFALPCAIASEDGAELVAASAPEKNHWLDEFASNP